MWLFIHRPFEFWPALGDLHIERVYMLATLGYWALFAPKTWTSNRITVGILSLAVAIILATMFSSYTDFDSVFVQNWFKILLFHVLVLSSIRTERELRILIAGFVGILIVYELHSLREYMCGRGEYRMGTWRMVGVDRLLGDPNAFAASVNYGLPMLLPVAALVRRKWQWLVLLGWVALSCLCVLLTGSRTGFAGLVVLAVAAALASRYRKHLTLLVVVAAPLIWFSLSAELQNRYTTLIDPSVGPENAKSSADSRKVFFWMAVEIWKEQPIFGIGPACFSIASGTGLQAHTLYAETLAELGLCGVVALSLMVLCYVFNYLEARRIYRAIPPPNDALFCYRIVQATTVTMLQLLFFGLGGHNLFRFTWLWYGAFAALALRFLREHYNEHVRSEQAAVEQVWHDRAADITPQLAAMAVDSSQPAAGQLAR